MLRRFPVCVSVYVCKCVLQLVGRWVGHFHSHNVVHAADRMRVGRTIVSLVGDDLGMLTGWHGGQCICLVVVFGGIVGLWVDGLLGGMVGVLACWLDCRLVDWGWV